MGPAVSCGSIRHLQAARLNEQGRPLGSALQEAGIPPFAHRGSEEQLRHLGRERIQRLGVHLSAGQQPRVRRVVTFHPSADAMEMAVVVGFGKRIHALAVRLERADCGQPVSGRAAQSGKWLCTTVEAA